ncbi:MAG: GHKL domain-containing protein [Gracilimonas sp.]|uniref:sensor histidine kinase n=1 Tax=Gracilimonas TaxID=649462 RepID=UPI001B0E37AF|nr:sensor histidine kinase [Gracilimonas sp.]MBO6584561.1 GHKL domain-containing protein [Gracilimonas sp.]MBO6616168.1 GHKL domain-containing protein [Gracilimonas sp.]
MNTLAIFFGLLLSVGIAENPVHQDTTLTAIEMADVTDTGRLLLSSPKFDKSWRYHPGDNPEWADPDFNDSSWHNIPPGGLRASEMPDSLWPGYGWWRIQFIADSAFYKENWNLYFYGFGAAEVYLDGKLIKNYGIFSVHPESETTFSPNTKLKESVSIEPGGIHTLAVRYSFHQAKPYQQLFGKTATDLGFTMGFSTASYNKYLSAEIDFRIFTASFTGGILLMLFLIHLMLYLKFPEDPSNPVIILVILCLLIGSLTVHSFAFIEYKTLGYILADYTWNLLCAFPFTILPFVIALLFRLKNYYQVIHFAWVFLAYALIYHFDFYLAYSALGVLFISFVLSAFLIRVAYRRKKTGLVYIAGGILASIICVIIYWLEVLGVYTLSSFLSYLNTTLAFSSIPFGLSLFISHRYGELYGTMENLVKKRTRELEESLENLQATQEQLIQQEKLASLGQLTAGIAHEIKNPLNFVNNFSELSVELIEETKEELSALSDQLSAEDKGRIKEANDNLNDIDKNLRKIHVHGTRADSIVKSMLEHSRGGSGKMEPTDLNALVKEFVNLSFHGMRASKNPINVAMDFELDDSIGEVPLIPEDFSRVIINLCNNAFDAMREKLSVGSPQLSGSEGKEYKPKLTVRTYEKNQATFIEIEDNGPGISPDIKEKILQPFFTTKKGTEGTGLGLSITNDIIKAHGGFLEVSTNQHEGTCLTIKLSPGG